MTPGNSRRSAKVFDDLMSAIRRYRDVLRWLLGATLLEELDFRDFRRR